MSKIFLLLLVSLLVTQTAGGPRSLRAVFNGIFVPGTQYQETSDNKVQESVEKTLNEGYSVTENEFTALRIEYIKNQILKKLRLKEKPNIRITDLPKPVKEYENLIPNQDDNILSSYSDDFYGKTTQAIIFPFEGKILF